MTETLDHHPVKQVAGDSTGVPPLPHHNRRPKAREVSSRFMSPVVSTMDSTSTSPKHSHSVPASPSPVSSPAESQSRNHIFNHHRSKTVQHPNRRSQDQDSLFSDETSRSWDTPLRSHNRSLSSSSSSSVVRSLQMKPRAAVKLYKENGEGTRTETTQLKQQNSDVNKTLTLGRNGKNVTATPLLLPSSSRQRPDTPQIGTERVVPSRFRLSTQNFQRRAAATTAAAKLLQSSGLSSMSADSQDETTSIESDDNKSVASTNDNNGDPVEFSSSVDSLNFTKVSSSSPCSRSLNFTPSGFSEHGALKPSESLVLRSSSTKMGNISLPPHPKPGAADAAKKGRKMVSTHQDDIHSLKLLHNRYLQLRFANAKAELSMSAQRRESERKIYSLGVKTSELREVVTRKRAELGILQRARTLSTILEAHMPYLDEWSAVEEDYSNSLSGVSQSLVNSSLRLPVSGDVQADARELTDALNSATSVMQMIGVHVNRFLPKANEMDSLISELSGVVHGEKALVEECGDLLFKDYASQVEDCSLRGHIMQLKRINCIQPIQEE